MLIIIHAGSVFVVIERVSGMSMVLSVVLVLGKDLNWLVGLVASIVLSLWATGELPVKGSRSRVSMTVIVHGGSGWVVIVGISSHNLSQRLLIWSENGLDLLAATRRELTNDNWSFRELTRLRVNPSVIVHTGSILIVIKRVFLVPMVMVVLFSVAERLLVWSDNSLNLFATFWWELSNHDCSLLELSRLGVDPSVIVHGGSIVIIVESILLFSVRLSKGSISLEIIERISALEIFLNLLS